MRIRAWIGEALTGSIVGEVVLTGGSQLATRFGGGDCSATFSLAHLTTRDGQGMDSATVARVVAWAEGGRYTLVVTGDGQEMLGEWLLMKCVPDLLSGSIAVRGMEWDGYPALRSLNDNYIYKNVDQYQIARDLLTAAFISYQPDMQIALPSGTSGVTRTMDHKSHTAYYSDLLDEIADADGGFEWKVRSTLTWAGGVPTKVSRSVVFGRPVLSSGSPVVARSYGPGSRAGNITNLTSSRDFSRYAQSVYGWGAGEGGKQKWVGLSDPTLTQQGYPIATKNVTFDGVTDTATLTALTRQALTQAQDLRDPWDVELLLDRTDALPTVGGQVRVLVDRAWAAPAGVDETMRVGSVEWTPDGHRVERVAVKAA